MAAAVWSCLQGSPECGCTFASMLGRAGASTPEDGRGAGGAASLKAALRAVLAQRHGKSRKEEEGGGGGSRRRSKKEGKKDGKSKHKRKKEHGSSSKHRRSKSSKKRHRSSER